MKPAAAWFGQLLLAAGLAAAQGAAAAATGGLAFTPCWLDGWPQAARCAVLQRPLDPARPGGVQIGLHVAVVPALARNKQPDPVFFFAGGPGQSAIALAGSLAGAFGRLQQRRDLVFIDQRGTGRSAPLACPDDAPRAVLQPLAQRSDEAQRLQQLQACRLALQALPHGDLRFYTTELAAADAEAVRQALAITRYNAVGFSYGTRVVLDLQRRFGPTLRRVVLDGVVPPDMGLVAAAALDNQAAWNALLQACAAETSCQRRHPGLASALPRLLQRLPLAVQLPHPVTGRLETVQLQRDTVLAMLRAPLYSPGWAAALPAALADAAEGRWAPLAALALAPGGGGAGQVASGQHFSVVCSEDLPAAAGGAGGAAAPPPAPASPVAALFDTQALYQAACKDWPRGQVSAGFTALAPAVAPTWLLSGALDPVTPPRHGQRVAQALGPLARHVVVANTGHNTLALACVRDAAVRFIQADDDAQALALPVDCAAGVPRPPFFHLPGAAP